MQANHNLLLSVLLLAACSKQPSSQQDLDSLDKELTAGASVGNQRDPALTAALRDQIMVDPALTQTANTNVVRPPSRPDPLSVPPDLPARPDGVTAADLKPTPAAGADCPQCRKADGALTLGELAARQSHDGGACAQRVRYSATWSTRLPAAVPLYPDAQVREAAGNDACGLRVVSFTSGAPVGRILDWYNARVTRAGYSAEHQAAGARHVLGGTRGDSAYVVYVTANPAGGSAVDLLVR